MLQRAGNSVADGGKPSRLARLFGAFGWTLARRIAVVLAALLILYWRTPTTFTNPQFWGEDVILFSGARLDGWSALWTTVAGYLVSSQFLVGILASYFNPIVAPAIYSYAAIFLTLVVVWLITSPRLDMPAKSLLALAVVIVPMAWEELGTIINIQWILPIGVFALLFMDPPKSRVVVFGEAILVALTSFSGPFSIFLTPLYIWKLITVRLGAERNRLAILTAIVALGALTQVFMILGHSDAVYSGPVVPYSPTLWINLPFERILTVFGPVSHRFRGLHGAVLGLVLLAGAIALALRPPFRLQKIFMILFAIALSLGGLYKFRADLGNQIIPADPMNGGRYFYVASVFSLWFICCLSSHRYVRFGLAAVVAATELMLLPLVANTPRTTTDMEWRTWAKYIDSGLPVIIPTSPGGWYLNLPAAPAGPLAHFASWLGQDINQIAETDPSVCSGTMDVVLPLTLAQPVAQSAGRKKLWTVTGALWDASGHETVPLIALVDQTGKVMGFGQSGFRAQEHSQVGSLHSKWIANFSGEPGMIVSAYGIVRDGHRACRLPRARRIPASTIFLPSNKFVTAIPLTSDQEITQSFTPAPTLFAILAQFVTWGRPSTPYTIHWKVVASMPSQHVELGSGEIDTTEIYDWQPVELRISDLPDPAPQAITVSFKARTAGPITAPAGVPLFSSKIGVVGSPAQIGTDPAPAGAQLGLTLLYAD
jgi:hypothetical protein